MKNNLRLTLIASSVLTSVVVASPVFASDTICGDKGFCTKPESKGAISYTSQVTVREDNKTPPSAEYRRPADETVVMRPDISKQQENETNPVLPFASGDATLTQGEKDTLSLLARRLEKQPAERIEIVGFADVQNMTQQVQEQYKNNQILSKERAKQTGVFLRTFPHLSSVPLFFAGMGDTKPSTKCNASGSQQSPEKMKAYQDCLAFDRRVEVRVWHTPKAVLNGACKASGFQWMVSL
jgi:outer membrane protein OmpA-like peptidoglycan-associated protein